MSAYRPQLLCFDQDGDGMFKIMTGFLISLFAQHTLAATPSLPPQLEQKFNVNFKLNSFSPTEEAKIVRAVELIKKVVKSSEFRERILTHEYQGTRAFVDNDGRSNEEIYQLILEGAEMLNPAKNSQMDIDLELYYEPANTIGHTYPNVNSIWINRKYFDHFTPAQVADNLFHEWLHKLGFRHEAKYSATRRYSVPYAIGYLVKELAMREE
jgi:hypothetical protein